jgi:hypothetical protein
VIPPGLARRVVAGPVDASVFQLTTVVNMMAMPGAPVTPSTKVEFRVLDFRMAE